MDCQNLEDATPSRSGNRVPRPRNAFMIFRSEFWAEEKINRKVEHDHRHISRIIGHCWNQMSEPEKDVWRRKAEQEKADHERKHPGYRFCPTIRTKKPIKRKVKRNGESELLRCRQVAELLLAGKEGDELATAVMQISPPSTLQTGSLEAIPSMTQESVNNDCWPDRAELDLPPFRSPLLPPPTLQCATSSPPIPLPTASSCADLIAPNFPSWYSDWGAAFSMVPGQYRAVGENSYMSLSSADANQPSSEVLWQTSHVPTHYPPASEPIPALPFVYPIPSYASLFDPFTYDICEFPDMLGPSQSSCPSELSFTFSWNPLATSY